MEKTEYLQRFIDGLQATEVGECQAICVRGGVCLPLRRVVWLGLHGILVKVTINEILEALHTGWTYTLV